MMLEHLGAQDAADAIVSAIARVLASGENLTQDMGGTASTTSLGQAIADALSLHPLEARRHG
jgi:tartrate dehydrogenase/decarboxylase/D-malate dehydrogenase